MRYSELGNLELYFLDVGYGDSTLMMLPEGGSVLVDAGGPEQAVAVAEALRRAGVKRLDYMVVTHFHKDHAGGVGRILREFLPDGLISEPEGRILIAEFPIEVKPELEPTLAEIRKRSWRILKRGDAIQASPTVRLEVLHPEIQTGDRNEDSMVLQVRHHEVSFLLAADIQKCGQAELVGKYKNRLKSTLIKIPHHAAEAAEGFVETVLPTMAVLSVGPNPYHAPNSEVVDSYRKIGARVYRTDVEGTIVARSNGRSIQIHVDHTV